MTITKTGGCPRCGQPSENSIGRGRGQRQCKGCGKYYPGNNESRELKEKIQQSGNAREVVTISPVRITNEKELVSQCEIDLDEWEIERWVCNKWEVGAKDKNNKITVEPLYQVKVWLVRRVQEIVARKVIDRLMADARKYAPKYSKIKYPKHDQGLVYEIDMPDLHFGKLTWNEETGQDYDIQIAAKFARTAFADLLGYVKNFPVSKILLPTGNDFYNVNGSGEFTVNGTRQIEDTRWQKTFVQGRKLLVELIEMCSQVALVDVMIVPGNHDRERMFYAGDALECWFHGNPNVFIDNRAQLRKYRAWGRNMILFTHGSEEKFSMIPSIMAFEEPKMWGGALHREAHIGDRHHKEVMIENVKEMKGTVIRMMRSMTPLDEWHYRTGWVGAAQASESYLWHPEKGVIAQFTSMQIDV